MYLSSIHHIKTYIVIFFLLIALFGTLLYLYVPNNIRTRILSSFMDVAWFSSGKWDTFWENSELEIPKEKIPVDSASVRRMRLTQMLLRSKKDLQKLETERKNTENGLDSIIEQNIARLQKRIQNLETLITNTK